MRILHLTTFVQGGAGLVMTELASAQARRGHTVSLVTSRSGPPGYGNYPEHLLRLSDAGVRVCEVDSMFSRDPLQHAPVARLIDNDLGGAGAFDLIHTHAAVPGALACAAAARAPQRVPVIQTMHGWGVSKTAAQADFDVSVMNRVDRLILPAATSAALVSAIGVRRDHQAIVFYGVTAVRAAAPDHLAERMRAWRRSGEFVICTIGTLGARKNQRLLISALSMDETRRCRVVIVGDGPAGDLRAAAAAAGVADRVTLAGYRPHARRYLREADLFVLPSRAEGQPLAILEAFCDGTPVLVSAVPELQELVQHDVTGWTFAPDDARSLAAAIGRTMRTGRDDRRALVARARAVQATRFTIDRMVEDYMIEYQRAA